MDALTKPIEWALSHGKGNYCLGCRKAKVVGIVDESPMVDCAAGHWQQQELGKVLEGSRAHMPFRYRKDCPDREGE